MEMMIYFTQTGRLWGVWSLFGGGRGLVLKNFDCNVNIIYSFCSGTHHLNQCDVPFVAQNSLPRVGLKDSCLDSKTAHYVNMDMCHAFLRRHLLKGE